MKKDEQKKPLAKIEKVAITYEMFEGWMVTALEGGSNYWYYLKTESIPKEILDTYLPDKTPITIVLSKAIWIEKATIPIHCEETGEKLGEINMKSVKKALETICDSYDSTFDALMSDSYDAIDADIFFQIAVMNELTFG